MKKSTIFILLPSILCFGAAFAQSPSVDNKTYATGIIYMSAPLYAKNYKKCISSTKENARLSDEQQIGCEESYNPSSKNIKRSIDLKLANAIIQRWGNDSFFNNVSDYIYQLDEITKNRSVYLWPDGNNWMTPVDDGRYQLLPFSIYLSVVNHSTGGIRSVPVILYTKNKSSLAEYVKDFDLVTAKEGELNLNIYRYKNGKRKLSEQYTINQLGSLIRAP